MNDEYNILKEWGIVKSESTDTTSSVSTPKSTSSSKLASLQSQCKILKYTLTPEQCKSTQKCRSQSSTPKSTKSFTKSQQNTPKRILHYQLTVQQVKELNERNGSSTPSKSSTISKISTISQCSINTNETSKTDNNKNNENDNNKSIETDNNNSNNISSNCSNRRYEYSYPYLPETQPISKNDIKIARCVSGTKDALLLADYLRLISPRKKVVYDYSVKPCDNNKPIPKYTGNVKVLSPTKSREVESFYRTTNQNYGEI